MDTETIKKLITSYCTDNGYVLDTQKRQCNDINGSLNVAIEFDKNANLVITIVNLSKRGYEKWSETLSLDSLDLDDENYGMQIHDLIVSVISKRFFVFI
jgi:ribosomal protein S8